jgi:hypothetical protein
MRAFAQSNTAFDLLANDIPIGSTAVVNGANGLILQGADDSAFTSPVTLATTTTAAPWQTVVLAYRYIRVSTSAVMSILYP